MSMPETLDDLPRRLARWAANRYLAPVSVAGVSLAIGICAAGWFSAGTRPDNVNGALALCVSYLVSRAAARLANPPWSAATGPAADATNQLTEWCGVMSEYAVYAGLAVGGYEEHWGDTWQLAVAVMIVLAVRRTVVACGDQTASAAGSGSPASRAVRGFLSCPPGGRIALITLAAPIWGARATLLVLLEWAIIAVGYAITGRGPYRPAVTATATAELVEPAYLATSAIPLAGVQVEPTVPVESAAADSTAWVESAAWVEQGHPASAHPASGHPAEAAVPAESAVTAESGGPAEHAAANHAAASQTELPLDLADLFDPADPLDLADPLGLDDPPDRLDLDDPPDRTMALDLLIPSDLAVPEEAAPEPVADPRVLATMAACRDDGVAAVWLGQLVRGQFVPLPPALAGLAATAFLAWLGMRNLPGVLLLTPLVVMALAAFGSSHSHNGRLDWLTPAVLLAGQLLYFAAVGFSFRVPPPVTFAVCALTALRYAELAGLSWTDAGQIPETKLGWEGRMFIAGLGAIVGLALIAYLLLAAYLIVLIYVKFMTSSLVAREGEYR